MKVLYVVTLAMTVNAFLVPHIRLLREMGCTVDIACKRDQPLSKEIGDMNCRVIELPFSRAPLAAENLSAYRRLKALVDENHYDIVHCHTPNASAITRLACRGARKRGTKVMYTCHGFHFFKGAPLKNWLLFFPVEWLCSYWTDMLICINREDFHLAQYHLHAANTAYISGAGLDVNKFAAAAGDRAEKRCQIGVPEDCFLALSVGELGKRKNHETIIRALAQLHDAHIHYAIAGAGALCTYLKELARKLGVGDNVHLLGYRTDTAELYHTADVFCFPSVREGLGLGALEAMASGLPIVTSAIHGINDYSVSKVTGFSCPPKDVKAFAAALHQLCNDKEMCERMGRFNAEAVKRFDISLVLDEIRRIYQTEMPSVKSAPARR